MAYLFKIEDKIVFPNPETLLIEPFKTIWDRDKSKNKNVAIQEFSYIEFMSSMKTTNPYRQYAEKDKHEVIKNAVIKEKDWKPDEFVLKSIDKLKEFQKEGSMTYNFYMSAKKAAEKMQDFFNTVDINERGGKFETPIWKPRDITSALNDTEKVLTNLKGLEDKVNQELFESVKNRSDKQISPLADPSSLL